MELILADDDFCHLDEVAAQLQEGLAELTVLLDLSCKLDGRDLHHFLLQLLQEQLAARVEPHQLLLRVLQLPQQLRLIAGEVAHPVVQTDQHVYYSQEHHALPVLQLRELHRPVEGLQLRDLLADSSQLGQFLLQRPRGEPLPPVDLLVGELFVGLLHVVGVGGRLLLALVVALVAVGVQQPKCLSKAVA
jgi:hypothetical protein